MAVLQMINKRNGEEFTEQVQGVPETKTSPPMTFRCCTPSPVDGSSQPHSFTTDSKAKMMSQSGRAGTFHATFAVGQQDSNRKTSSVSALSSPSQPLSA